jgi:hypothetical protein
MHDDRQSDNINQGEGDLLGPAKGLRDRVTCAETGVGPAKFLAEQQLFCGESR